jgi:hypothetical protein
MSPSPPTLRLPPGYFSPHALALPTPSPQIQSNLQRRRPPHRRRAHAACSATLSLLLRWGCTAGGLSARRLPRTHWHLCRPCRPYMRCTRRSRCTLQVGSGGFAPTSSCSPAASAEAIARALPVDHLRSMLADGSMSTLPPHASAGGGSGVCSVKLKRLIVFVREVSEVPVRFLLRTHYHPLIVSLTC